MNRCGECRHWGCSSDQLEIFRSCQAVPHGTYSVYGSTRQEDIESAMYDDEELASREQMSSAKALACDASGYAACLRTREDFGCVLFQPHENRS